MSQQIRTVPPGYAATHRSLYTHSHVLFALKNRSVVQIRQVSPHVSLPSNDDACPPEKPFGHIPSGQHPSESSLNPDGHLMTEDSSTPRTSHPRSLPYLLDGPRRLVLHSLHLEVLLQVGVLEVAAAMQALHGRREGILPLTVAGARCRPHHTVRTGKLGLLKRLMLLHSKVRTVT